MLMLEIERLEKEERELLGLKKGEKLSALHYDESIDQENAILIGKRTDQSSLQQQILASQAHDSVKKLKV
jgi:hypothetical protein